MIRFGCKYAMQNPDVFDKSVKNAYRLKTYKFPSGKEVKCQGYEPFCLDDLLKEGCEEKDIMNKRIEVPMIPYNWEDKDRIYYPDIYVSKDNLIIEVKSKHTFEKRKEQNLAKAEATIAMGFNYEFRIYNAKGKLVETMKYYHDDI